MHYRTRQKRKTFQKNHKNFKMNLSDSESAQLAASNIKLFIISFRLLRESSVGIEKKGIMDQWIIPHPQNFFGM